MNTNTTTKVTKLTGQQAAALKAGVAAGALYAEVTKTTVTFGTDAKEAASQIRTYQEVLAAKSGRVGGDYQALHAVARKLENGKDIETATTEAPAEESPVEEVASPSERVGEWLDESVRAFEAAADETPKLELVADSTDPESLKNLPGVFGPSVQDAVEEEKARRTAMKAADEHLEAAGYQKRDDSVPTWGTAKFHGLKKGDLFLFYGTNDKGPKAEPTVRNFDQARIGGVAKKFWAAKSEPKKAEKAAPAKKDATAKKSAGARTIPAEAANKVRQAWIAENGMDAYKKQYNSGWDNATYGSGAKKAESGEASVAYMDGYTDRKANPGKAGIAAKWAALKATTAPVKKVAAEKKA